MEKENGNNKTLHNPDPEFEIKAAILFQILPGISPAIQHFLLESYGSFSALLHQSMLGFTIKTLPKAVKDFMSKPALWWAKVDQVLETCAENAVKIIPVTLDDFPRLLKEINSPPPVLFVQGAITILDLPQIAIVGSRKATVSGINNAKAFAAILAGNGFTITSGLALGIDTAAHQGALQTGNTIAVLGCGLDVVYPRRNQPLSQEILASGGALVSEFLPGTPPLAQNFPRRNRIISGLSMGVLVVEAAVKSGSLITSRISLQQDREVFAIPGSIHNPLSRGCHQLIREGATLVETAEHIIEQLGGLLSFKHQQLSTKLAESGELLDKKTKTVFTAIGFDPTDIDDLVNQTGLQLGELTESLLLLELEGLISHQQGVITRIR